jgi:DNA-binding FrmR family transcriptional regulator
MSNKQLVHRLNRASGQINGIKRSLDNNDVDCVTTLQQLKASINALKKFGEAFMKDHLETCIKQGMSAEEAKAKMLSAISGVFF